MKEFEAPAQEINDTANQWIAFFEHCEREKITVGEAYEAVRQYKARFTGGNDG